MAEFERSIGWEGPAFNDLIGRDITRLLSGQDRRGPISKVAVDITPPQENVTDGYVMIEFRVRWVGLWEDDEWKLENEAGSKEGTPLYGINSKYTQLKIDQKTGELRLGESTIIHAVGNNIGKPQNPASHTFRTD